MNISLLLVCNIMIISTAKIEWNLVILKQKNFVILYLIKGHYHDMISEINDNMFIECHQNISSLSLASQKVSISVARKNTESSISTGGNIL